MWGRVDRWLDERIGHRELLTEALDEPIAGGASWAYVFGSATLVLFLVQLATGLVLAMYYSPSATDAWASVAYIEREVAFGAVVRGLHHHTAGAMVVMAVLHMLQVVLYGAYKAPREANWLTGLALFGLVLAFALTGYLLPWDQTGYWATKVATSIAGTVPLVGEHLQVVLQGGNDYGSLTLTRFYALHVILLPLTILALIAVHVSLFRRHGVTPHPSKTPADLKRVDRFFPKQVAMEAAFGFVLIAFLFIVAVRVGAPLEAPADPASNFIARPEWYFLFLFQLLKYFEGPMQVVGTVILPGLVTLFLVALPFVDRGRDRRLGTRKLWLGLVGAGLAAVVCLTGLAVLHDRADPTIARQRVVAHREAERARTLAASGVPAAGATFMMASDPLTRGERLFWRECATCHVLEGFGPEAPEAPDLTGFGSKAWLRQVLRDPDSPRLYGLTAIEGMSSYAELPPDTLQRLVDILYARRSTSAPLADSLTEDFLDTHECTDCHEFDESAGLEGPTLWRYLSRDWIRDMIDNPGADHLYGESNDMPQYSKRLTASDRSALVDFVMSLEARGDPNAWPFIDDPGPVPSPRPPVSEAP